MEKSLWVAAIPTIPAIFAILFSMYNAWQIRKSQIKKLGNLTNKQAGELIVLSTTLLQMIDVQIVLVDALDKKDVLNGDSKQIKEGLRNSRSSMMKYAQEQKNKGLYFNEKE